MKNNVKLAIIWLAPFLLGPFYAIGRYTLHSIVPEVISTPNSRSIFSLIFIEAISSPLWVVVGFAFTYVFGGVMVIYVIKALALNKLIGKRIVISTKARGTEISEMAKHGRHSLYFSQLTKNSFPLCLVLTLAINLAYTLTLQRYFQTVILPQTEPSQFLYDYLFSPALILTDFALALLFLPLLTTVAPLFFGRISVRQIDASRLDLYWLSYVFSFAGGASLVLFLFDVFQRKGSTAYFIIAIVLVYGILSWYIALGINLALPYAERRLARELTNLRDEMKSKDQEGRRIIFGNIFAGPTREEAEPV